MQQTQVLQTQTNKKVDEERFGIFSEYAKHILVISNKDGLLNLYLDNIITNIHFQDSYSIEKLITLSEYYSNFSTVDSLMYMILKLVKEKKYSLTTMPNGMMLTVFPPKDNVSNKQVSLKIPISYEHKPMNIVKGRKPLYTQTTNGPITSNEGGNTIQVMNNNLYMVNQGISQQEKDGLNYTNNIQNISNVDGNAESNIYISGGTLGGAFPGSRMSIDRRTSGTGRYAMGQMMNTGKPEERKNIE